MPQDRPKLLEPREGMVVSLTYLLESGYYVYIASIDESLMLELTPDMVDWVRTQYTLPEYVLIRDVKCTSSPGAHVTGVVVQPAMFVAGVTE